MNAPDPKLAGDTNPEERRARTEGDADLEGGWFVQPASQTVPAVRPKSVSPTGDDEVDTWLR